jgi:putative membrane protein insertion efficiency factor
MMTRNPAKEAMRLATFSNIKTSSQFVLNLLAVMATRGMIALVRVYQVTISPFTRPRCLYQPTCSEYARQALVVHGFSKGLLLAIKRLARCHPFADGGVDLVPSCCNDKPSAIQRSR